MNIPRLPTLSLRARLALGLGAVLLPFLLTAAVGQYYLLPRLTEPMEEIAEEALKELNPVIDLQAPLLMAAMPVNDYLIHGDPDERRQFADFRRNADQAFARASAAPFGLAQERALIESAHTEWQQALRLGEALLRLPNPVGNAAAARDMERFDAHIDRAVVLLGQLHDLIHQEINGHLAIARAAKQQALFITLGAFALAFGVSLLASLLLARPVLSALGVLGKATARLAAGDLSARATLDRQDEFGQLALAFDAMAEKLEKNEAALRELATRDGLTGLYNHRTFYTLLADELTRAQRFNRPVSLLMLDIDHFKRVNDTHGHQAGDAILRGLSGVLGQQARAIDRVCRYGGEEITLILPETDAAIAANIAERLRAEVARQPFKIGDGKSVPITVSIGVATFPDHADTPPALVTAADTAMYAAKQGGRSRVSRYAPIN